MIGRQERFVGSLDKKVQDYGEKKKKYKDLGRPEEVWFMRFDLIRYASL